MAHVRQREINRMLAAAPAERQNAQKVTEDVFASVCRDFQKSGKWLLAQADGGYAQSTKDNWARELNFIARPECLGALSVNEIRPKLTQAFFDGISDKPGKQQTCMAVLVQLEKWAVVQERLPLRQHGILFGVQIGKSSGGHIPWTDAQVALAERELPPHLSRVITLIANTGQRGSDIVRMREVHLEVDGGRLGINVVQKKTGKRLWIPLTDELQDAMASWERTPGPFITAPDGRPWTRNAMATAFTRACKSIDALSPLRLPPENRDPNDTKQYLELQEGDNAGNDGGLVLHGLRGTACVRLRRAGLEEGMIASLVGMSVEMVQRYCRQSNQKANAHAAVDLLEARRRAKQGENVVPLRA